MTTAPANSPVAKRRTRARDFERRALDLRIGGASFAQIAEVLGLSVPYCYKLVKNALAKTAEQTAALADKLREQENARLDAAQAAIWPQVMRGDIGAVQAFVRLSQRRATLNGLDAPTQQKIDATIAGVKGYVTISPDDWDANDESNQDIPPA